MVIINSSPWGRLSVATEEVTFAHPVDVTYDFFWLPVGLWGHVTESQEAAVWTNARGWIGSCDEGQVVQGVGHAKLGNHQSTNHASREDSMHQPLHKAWEQPQGLHGCCWVGMGWGGVCVLSENDSTHMG